MNRASLAAALAASLLVGFVSLAFASDKSPAKQPAEEDGSLAGDGIAPLRDHLLFTRELATGIFVGAAVPYGLAVSQAPRRTAPPPKPMVIITASVAERHAAEERLLGSADDDQRLRDYLPFTRETAVDGVVEGSFADSTAAAGVPAAAMLEALEALGTAIDLARDVRDGDRFHVRYEQTFTAAGAALDVGRVLWVELRTAKGTFAIHRFRARDGADRFWQANGQAATPPSMRMPLDVVSISSGFGLRADPFDQPPPRPTAGTAHAMGGSPGRHASKAPPKPALKPAPKLPPGLPTGGASEGPRVNIATPLGLANGLSAYGGLRSHAPLGGSHLAPRAGRTLFMHEGIDLVAPEGTPVYAAADGVVVGAAPNGRYGNWIRIEHDGKLATVYGHLSGFAPGIEPGVAVSRDQLIGFVGSTGRSTGAHLHFELLNDGKPVNPVIHPETKRGQLRGVELERFRKQVAQSRTERNRENELVKLYGH
jgi:murein DD-endopeptidase MepM/ murein hydrolase activator NlpD